MTRATALIASAFIAGTVAFVVLLVHTIEHPDLFPHDLAILAASCLLIVGSVIAAWRRRPSGTPDSVAGVYEMGYEQAVRR